MPRRGLALAVPPCGVVAWWVPPKVSQVPLCPFFDIKIEKDFSGIFRETIFSRVFRI
jgi:hypothetical protein